MTKETLEKAKELEKSISHTSEVIEFIKTRRYQNESYKDITNLFISTEADDYMNLSNSEVDFIIESLENKLYLLNQEFSIL